MLSALATSAVPGFQAVSAQSLSTPERDAALVHDVNSFAWLVELARTEPEEALMSARHSAARALSEGLSAQQTDEQFNAMLNDSIESIHQASRT